MVMPAGAPDYLQPQTSADFSHLGAWTTATITESGRQAIETGNVTGAGGQILNELNRESPQSLAELGDNADVPYGSYGDNLKREITRLARAGYLRITPRRE